MNILFLLLAIALFIALVLKNVPIVIARWTCMMELPPHT